VRGIGVGGADADRDRRSAPLGRRFRRPDGLGSGRGLGRRLRWRRPEEDAVDRRCRTAAGCRGAVHGRGRFDPGIALGDDAIGTSVEVRYGSLFPREADDLALEPFVFLDYAKAWLDDAIGGPDPRSVLSAGGGVRGRYGDWADFNLTLAAPLQRAGFQATKGDVRVLFTLTTRLLPWGDR
jgi:hypothetical protein